MNISQLVVHYVAFRRTLGERCRTCATILRAFCQAVGPQATVTGIGSDAVAAFLAGTGPLTGAWHIRYYALRGLFRFAVSRGHLDKVPLPTDLPKRAASLIPYIYSHEDLRRLLEAIPSYRRYRTRIEPPTLRAILLLLYGAGLRAREVLALTVADVDMSDRLLTIRATKFYKSRLVPVSRRLASVLADYARWRAVVHPGSHSVSPFFVGKRGTAVHLGTLEGAFRRLRQYAGVRRSDGARYQPRLHDLRHSFAVHRLTSWYRQGADVQRLLPHLCVYLGHVRLASTQVYLTMTPELLQHASRLFEDYAHGEGSHA
jgi:site-specific recombinase XerD